MIARTKQLASLAAAATSAIAVTGNAAKAGIIASPIFDVSIGFSSTAPTGRHATSHVFHSLAGGPAITFEAVSNVDGGTYSRFLRAFGVGMQLSNNGGVGRFSAGATMNPSAGIGDGFDVGDRSWGNNSSTHGLTAFTDKYFLFRFTSGSTLDYGWMEASMSVSQENSADATAGPTLTVYQWAYDDSGAEIAAGDTQSPSPEPATASEAGVAALILGAAGLRRWRKVRRERMPA